MNLPEISLEDVEKMDQAWNNTYLRKKAEEELEIPHPVDELEIFFKNLSGIRIFDSGCGTGRYISRFFEQGLEYVGLDQSSEALKIAQAAHPQAAFLLDSFRTLPFDDELFDGVWSCCALSGIPKSSLVAVLSEHRRVLKPGGVIMLVMQFNETSEEQVYETTIDSLPLYFASYHHDEFLQYVADAGFVIVDTRICTWTGSMYVLARK